MDRPRTRPRWRRKRGERGAGLVEYILVIVLLSVAVTGSMRFFSSCMGSKFTQAGNAVETGTVP